MNPEKPALKFCGLRSLADVDCINFLEPDYVGFVFWAKSKRAVTVGEAKALRQALKPKIKTVGVFVDAPIERIKMLADEGIIGTVQLHGNEDEAYLSRLREEVPEIDAWKAFVVKSPEDIDKANQSSADLVLLDGGKGDGDPFDWDLLAAMKKPFALAGGLNAGNLSEALLKSHPSLLDVSSGIEQDEPDSSGKPRKDEEKMRAFYRASRKATRLANEARQAESRTSGTSTAKAGTVNVSKNSLAPEQSHACEPSLNEANTPSNDRTSQSTTPETTIPSSPTPKGPAMTNAATENSPKSRGRFGTHGGQYIPETLMNAVIELEEAYNHYKDDPEFKAELKDLLDNYANRPSLLYYAEKMTRDLDGCKIYLKREDLNHTGAHKINNALGQALLAKKMGKTRLIAETGAGQHGVATATVAALLDMECHVYMGVEDMERQALNVYRMRLMGAEVHGVDAGTGTLKDAVSECMREWTSRIEDTHYLLGSCMGPHPFPTIVRDFQSFIGNEIIDQCKEKEGRLPDYVLACVGGGSNAIGTFYPFIEHTDTTLIGCEAAGRGIDTFETAATINTGSLGIFHGMKSYFCQDEYGQIAPVYSISAGLDYPGIGPEHAWLHDTGRAQYVAITDDEAVDAFEYLSRTEGIIPAIESAHALAYAIKIAPTLPKDKIMVITLSGRGDKDCVAMARYRGQDISE